MLKIDILRQQFSGKKALKFDEMKDTLDVEDSLLKVTKSLEESIEVVLTFKPQMDVELKFDPKNTQLVDGWEMDIVNLALSIEWVQTALVPLQMYMFGVASLKEPVENVDEVDVTSEVKVEGEHNDQA